MRTNKVNTATPVVEIPTLQAIARQKKQVNSLYHQLMQSMESGTCEQTRNLWGKARAELSRMQMLYHYGRKEACHA